MLSTDVPAKFPVAFASSAGVDTRQVPTSPGPVPGAASLQLGFPPLTFIQPSVGGIPPDGRDMNGILQQSTAWLRWLSAGGPIVHDATFAASVGGYPRGALIQSTSGHVIYENLVDNNLTDPNGGGANWRVAFSPWSARYWTAVGSANAQVLTLTPAPTVLGQLIGIPISFFSQGLNTGPVTLNVNGLGNVALNQASGTPLGQNAVSTGGAYTAVYNGASFLLTSQITSFSDTGLGGTTVDGRANVNGANLALLGNGGTTPNKFIRALSGALQIINSAYTAAIATFTDAGNMTIAGSIGSGGAISATTGNITALTGRLRAGFGAFQSGDPNAATILGDFFASFTIPGYCLYPNGMVIQWGANTVPANTTLTVNYLLTFPTEPLVGASLIGGTVATSSLPATLNIRNVGATNGHLQIINPNASSIAYDWIVVGH